MPTAILPRISAFVFIASCLLLSQQESTNPPVTRQTNGPAQQQPANSSPTPPQNQEPGRTPKEEAWNLLHTACTGGVLGLLPDNTQAREIAEKALADEKPEVRSSAAAALGAMHSKASIAKLREAADDQEPSVALAAARALIALLRSTDRRAKSREGTNRVAEGGSQGSEENG